MRKEFNKNLVLVIEIRTKIINTLQRIHRWITNLFIFSFLEYLNGMK